MLKVMGIVGNTLYQFIEGARIEIKCSISDGVKSDLMEYEDVVEYSSYEELGRAYWTAQGFFEN